MAGNSGIPWAKITARWTAERLRRLAERRAAGDPDQLAEDVAIDAYREAFAPLTDNEFATMLGGGACITSVTDGEVRRRILRPEDLA